MRYLDFIYKLLNSKGLVIILTLITLMACEEIGPTNSFDPQAPTDIKSLGIVRGRVVLPDLVNAETLLTQIRIELRRLAELDVSFLDAMREDQGRFSFPDLAEDRYQLQISLEGFQPIRYTLIMEIGGLIDLGDIPLIPTVNSTTGDISIGVTGNVRRENAPEGSHGGILVESIDQIFSTMSNSDGSFYLTLPPGEHNLKVSTPFYQTERVFSVLVSPDQVTSIEDPIVLSPNPSQVRGSVSLGGVLEGSPLESVVVRLIENANDPVMDAIQTNTVDDFGRFIFDSVPVKPLWIDVSCAGYFSQLRPQIYHLLNIQNTINQHFLTNYINLS